MELISWKEVQSWKRTCLYGNKHNLNAKNQIQLKQGGKPMNLTEYVNLDHHLYINDNFLETLLNQGEIQFKRSSYSNDRNHVERDSGFIASYNIAKNDEDQKSDACLLYTSPSPRD